MMKKFVATATATATYLAVGSSTIYVATVAAAEVTTTGADTTREITTTAGGYVCDTSVNYVVDNPGAYEEEGIPDKYSTMESALAYCEQRASRYFGSFFYKQHQNGRKVCGFFIQRISKPKVWDSSIKDGEGAVCTKKTEITTIPELPVNFDYVCDTSVNYVVDNP